MHTEMMSVLSAMRENSVPVKWNETPAVSQAYQYRHISNNIAAAKSN